MLKLTEFCIIESNNVQLLYKMLYVSIWLYSSFYIRQYKHLLYAFAPYDLFWNSHGFFKYSTQINIKLFICFNT